MFSPSISEQSGYTIANSLRLRSSASAYLSRTFGAGDQQKWTFSRWFKRGAMGVRQNILQVGAVGGCVLYVESDDTLHLSLNISAAETRATTQVFRDPSAWYHLVVAIDTTQATPANRVKLYVNGAQVTSFSVSNDPALNATPAFNSAAAHTFGQSTAQVAGFLDGYEAEIQWVGGQQLDPSYFGTTNSDGVWTPKAYTGTYGTNGFYLKFNDGSNLTNLCLDRSGNGNNWTSTNVSLTAGATYDWMADTPTNNYAVLNPIDQNGTTVAEANLRMTAGNAIVNNVYGSMRLPASGKWYYEFKNSNGSDANNNLWFGLTADNAAPSIAYNSASRLLLQTSSGGSLWLNGSTLITGLPVLNSAYTYQVAVDMVNLKAWIGYHDGTTQRWYNSSGGTTGDPATGANPTFTLSSSYTYTPICGMQATGGWFWYANFGARGFDRTPPTGFKALCTANRGTGSITTSGSFTGNANADGPVVWLNGNPESLTINGNAVTWGTHADKLAGGFKVRTASASYNASGANTYTVTTTGKLFGDLAHAPNTAKGNP